MHLLSWHLTTFAISYNSSFGNINVAIPDAKTFFLIAASVADTAAVNVRRNRRPWDSGFKLISS